jgi:hypothetical protein
MRSLVIVFLLVAASASAQQAQTSELTYPGSIWSMAGKGSVAEPGNNTTMTHAEQGVAQGPFSILVETTIGADTKGYDWNRRFVGGLLARYTLKIAGGNIRGNFGYETEKRFVNSRVLSGFVYSVDCWFGWELKK